MALTPNQENQEHSCLHGRKDYNPGVRIAPFSLVIHLVTDSVSWQSAVYDVIKRAMECCRRIIVP
ncbi:hypothetical protein OUZ56_013963 [Daphnia magna]|uniref:Uncharacterized protein n=1 Tax=Daphnia magna TaxID=35525 RepID=A0ABQ9Z7G8_9CRUS|nr:hypothetical protein OUZ56_013963 [Daphnia magna]